VTKIITNVSPCAGCTESEGDCPVCKENTTAMADAHRSDLDAQLATAHRALNDVDVEIARQERLKKTWQKICGSLEYQIYGRILP